MKEIPITGGQIQNEIKAIVERTNQKVRETNALPQSVRSQLDTQIFDDIDYLLRYITALHGILGDVASQPKEESTFDFN